MKDSLQLDPDFRLMAYAINGPLNVGLVVGAGVTGTASFTINDNLFQALRMMYAATSPLLRIQITGKRGAIFAAPILIGTLAGVAGGAFPVPIVPGMLTFLPRETITVDFIDFSGFANTVFFSVIGREKVGS